MDGMRGRRVSELLTLPVRHDSIGLGRAVDALFDLEAGRTLGLEIHCGDESRRFLPLGAARLRADATEVGSPLSLLDDLAFYRARGTAFRDLRGVQVARGRVTLGTLADLLVADDGEISGLVLDTPSGQVETAFTPTVALLRERRASAA
jgi:hypothetical protein